MLLLCGVDRVLDVDDGRDGNEAALFFGDKVRLGFGVQQPIDLE
jgi:hypothetical protein